MAYRISLVGFPSEPKSQICSNLSHSSVSLHYLLVSSHKVCSSSLFVVVVNGTTLSTQLCSPETRGYARLAVSLHLTLNSLPVSNGDKLELK